MNELVPHRRRLWLYALAALIVVFLAAPVFVVVPMSFSASRYLEFPPSGWSLRWYERFFSNPSWYESMLVSLKLAAVTVGVATPLGVAAAYAIHAGEHPVFKRIQTILMLPLMVPHIVVAVGIFYAYVRIGWLGSFGSLVLGHVMLALPFVLVTVLAGLRMFDMTQEMVARSLGCSRLEAFLRVTLPQIAGSVVSGMLFAFATSLDEVIVSLFIAAGENATVTKVMFSSLRDEIDPTTAAASSLMIGGSLLVALLAAVAGRGAFKLQRR